MIEDIDEDGYDFDDTGNGHDVPGDCVWQCELKIQLLMLMVQIVQHIHPS